MYLVLPTTRHFLDAVASGKKRVEYRRDIPYYRRKFSDPTVYRWLILHYRHPRFLLAEIASIDRMKRPRELEHSVFITTPTCYGIAIARVVGEYETLKGAMDVSLEIGLDRPKGEKRCQVKLRKKTVQ